MASLPARQPSQRRSSPTEQSRPTSAHQSRSESSPVRSRSDDSSSQPIFAHRPDQPQSQNASDKTVSAAAVAAAADDSSVKRCWICFEDSTDDTPDTSPWRSPCPCALEAHEECLLDWIADLEGPKNTRNRSITAPKIECPQCKSEIKLARGRDYLVDFVRACERLALKAVAPGALFMLSGLVYQSAVFHGIHSIYAVFGAEDGARILAPLQVNAIRPPIEVYLDHPVVATQQLEQLVLDHIIHWRLYLGIPLITPILVFSRTTLADGILPVLPIVFFASQAHSPDDALDLASWPPSASFSFAVLPYVRSLYNFYYQKVWAEKERRWMKELQPRSTQNQNEEAGNGDADENQREEPEDGNVFEVRIDGGLWEDWGDEQQGERPAQQAGEDEAAPGPDVQDNRPLPHGGGNEQRQQNAAPEQHQPQNQDQNANQQNGQQVDRRIAFSPITVAEKVLGSILFPTLAGLAGEALKLLVLPRSWTTPLALPSQGNSRFPAKGFFQHKWARSIVGGCLIVVCKDALMLYARWRMVQLHRGRRVVDFDRKKSHSKKGEKL